MLDLLGEGYPVGDVATSIAIEYGENEEDVEADILTLCRELLDRGLVEVRDDGRD
jgi:hypothetical protein